MSAEDHPTVVFDVGNVLVRWDPLPAIAAEVGEEEARRFLADDDFCFAAWNRQQDAGRGFAEAEAAAVAAYPQWKQAVLAYRRNFDRSMLGPLDGSVAVLTELSRAGVAVVGLTNWSAELFWCARRRFSFLRLLDDIVVSGEEGVAKPDPAIFGVLARRAGRPLSQCVLVDDTADNVTAAVELGMDALVFTGPAQLRADLVVRGLPLRP